MKSGRRSRTYGERPLKYQSIIRKNKPSKEQQLWLLENHPAFTGSCGNCGYEYPRNPLSWDCPECGASYD